MAIQVHYNTRKMQQSDKIYTEQERERRRTTPTSLVQRSKSKSLRRLNDPRPGLVRRIRIPGGSRRLRLPLRIFLHLALSIVLSVLTLLLGRVLFLVMLLLLMRPLLVAPWSSGPRVIRGGLPLCGRGRLTVRLFCRAVLTQSAELAGHLRSGAVGLVKLGSGNGEAAATDFDCLPLNEVGKCG